jgi:hypothetical protein
LSFAFDRDADVEGGLISLQKGDTVTKNVGGSGGPHAGKIKVAGTWLDSVGGIPGLLPVQLQFQLIKPNREVAASKTAYSNGEINPCCSSNKMNFTIPVDAHISGQWKLKLTNNSNDDTMNIYPKILPIGVCP